MDEEKLNRKLAEWAGFQQIPAFGGTDMSTTLWQFPDGSVPCMPHYNYPCPIEFTQSLDACFKWLVPKLGAYQISYKYYFDNYYHLARVANKVGIWREASNENNPALAFCLAIEKLIGREEEQDA